MFLAKICVVPDSFSVSVSSDISVSAVSDISVVSSSSVASVLSVLSVLSAVSSVTACSVTVSSLCETISVVSLTSNISKRNLTLLVKHSNQLIVNKIQTFLPPSRSVPIPSSKNTIQNDRSRDRKYFTTDSKDLSLFLKLDRRCRNTVGKSGDRHERTGTSPVCK